MIKEIEAILTSTLKSCLKDYVEHEDGFNIENVKLPSRRKAFHVLLKGVNTIEVNHNVFQENVSIQITLFLKSDRKIKAIIHEGLEDAKCFTNCFNKTFLDTQPTVQNPITNITAQNIEAKYADTNDDLVRIEITFEVIVFTSLEY